MEAQRHSHGLKDRSVKAPGTMIPQRFVAMAAVHEEQDSSPMQNNQEATAMRHIQARTKDSGKDALTNPATSASGIDSKWGGLQNKRQVRSTVTRITDITATARYPRAHKLSNPDQRLVKCPCCCQAIPVSELEDSQWR
jgi:hypothetical protein